MRSSCFALLASSAIAVEAQNLVVNPSFEEYVHCPTDFSQIDSVIGWQAIGGSPDYFNACADDTMTVPYNPAGYQWPSDGLGYAGVGFFETWNKEYMQGMLSTPLQPGVPTHVSMRVSPGIFGNPIFSSSPRYFASHIGLRFSTLPLSYQMSFGTLEFNTAVLDLPTILDDTLNWTILSATFVPDSAYGYVQIGSFFIDSLCQALEVDTVPDGLVFAYSFVDVVCVSQAIGVCDLLNGVTLMTNGAMSNGVGFHDVLVLPLEVWGLANDVEQAVLFDARGRLVKSMALGNTATLDWPLADLPEGLYAIELKLRDRPSVRIRSLKY